MAAESAARFEALEEQAEGIMAVFARAGYERVAPSIIQPADIFLDQVGEAIRSRTYIFTDPDGQELCLRPDLTIPACRIYLQRNPRGNREARYAYNGPAFRFQHGKPDALRPREFRQAGIECFGALDREQTEAESLALILEAVRGAGLRGFVLRLGDLGLLRALLEALPIPARWRGRLVASFWRPESFRANLKRLASPASPLADPAIASLARELDPEDRESAEARVGAFIEAGKLAFIGARTLGEITERLLAAAADMREQPLSGDVVQVIERYLAIAGSPEAAVRDIAALAVEARIDLGAALDRYSRRLHCFREAGAGLQHAHFAADFGRQLEYYSGFVFQIEMPGQGVAGQIAGGGRYDGLIASIGGPADVPAVGSAIHTERLLAARRGRVMAAGALILGIPSKGRLMEQTSDYFAAHSLTLRRLGHERGYRGAIDGLDDIQVAYLSASEIARQLQLGRIHLGVTGEDLIRENMADADERCHFVARLGFGRADVVVAVPQCWIDVASIADLEEAAAIFHRQHGRRLRVATKYMNLTRRFFAEKGFAGYRIVESLGATEGTPAAQTADIVVDITTTGTTLRANRLKVLDDGLMLRSQACLVASRVADWSPQSQAAEQRLAERLAA